MSLGLEKPGKIVVVDGTTGNVLTYRNIKQLLGENYILLNRRQQVKYLLFHQRHIAQRMAAPNDFGDSKLGKYIDRLLAKNYCDPPNIQSW